MRSIRRSLTVYLFVLLAATLAVVWVVIDQVTARALEARESAVVDLVNSRYEERCREERARVDQALLDQARALGNIMQDRYWSRINAEWANLRRLIEAAPVMFLTNPMNEAAWTLTAHFPGSPPNWNPRVGLLFRLYFANLPIPDDLLPRHFDDAHGADYFQINTPAGREWRSASLGGRKLPFETKEFDGKSDDGPSAIDWTTGQAVLGPDGESVRRVLYKVPHFSPAPPQFGGGFGRPRGPGGPGGPGRDDRDRKDERPPSPGGFGPPPNPTPSGGRSLIGTYTAWAGFGFAGPTPPALVGWAQGSQPAAPPTPTADNLPRLYIQCARPQAAMDASLARFAAERDDELARLAADLRATAHKIRARVTAVSVVAFLAVVLGGPLLVGRGLRPVGKLSDAVSRVSEKDFKLPHDGNDLAVELAPIHARLTQTFDLLQRAFAREKQAVADISHELRTPIAALMATIDVALRKPRTPEQYRASLEECRLISKQLGQLVERIMTLASLDAGNDRTMVSRTDACELASGCAAVIRPLAAANGVVVELRTEDGLELDTDPAKLREVLMNLLHNAVEYNKPDGIIELSARREGDSAVFEVCDTGIGMSPEVREKIFERFFRADPSRHATGVHAGLGLAIVKEYVARLGGTIAVESVPGDGSTFRVTLPAPAGDAARADEPVTAGVG